MRSEGILNPSAMVCELCTMKCALKSITATLTAKIERCFSQWSRISKGFWKYSRSLSSTIMNIMPAPSNTMPSSLERIPFKPSMIGSSISMAK